MSLPSQLENGKAAVTDPSAVPFELEKDDNNGQAVEPEKQVGMRGVRFATILMIIYWTCCIILRNAVKSIDLTSVKCGVEDKYALDPDVLKDCVRHTAIFRMAAVLALLLVAQALLSLFFVNKDSTALWDDWWLLVKYPFVVLSTFGLLFPAQLTFFDDATFAWIARFGAFGFICFQSIVFLDWAYTFNTSMLQKALAASGGGSMAAAGQRAADALTFSQVKSNMRLLCLLGFALVSLSGFFVCIGLLYKHYGHEGCPDNVFIITCSLVLVVAATLIQLGNSAGHGSVTTSAILSIYVAYTTYSAVALNPAAACNVSLSDAGDSYGMGPMVLGLLLSFLSILYITLIAARKIATMMSSGPLPLIGLLGIVAGYKSSAEYGTTGTKLDFNTAGVKVMIVNLNFVFLLVTFYIAMVMTNWGTIVSGFESVGSATAAAAELASSVAAGSVSMYMNAVGGWVATILYIIALIIPRWADCCPTSIWNMKMKCVQ